VGSPKYILPVAQSNSVIPVSLYALCRLPPAELNGGGGEKRIFLPQWPPSASLSSLDRCLQVLIRLPLSTVWNQIDCMYIYRDLDRYNMSYYNVLVNLVTVTKTIMIDKMPCCYRTLKTTTVRIRHQVSCRAAQKSQLLSKSPTDLCRRLSSSSI
jgi:hypothetical protein